ncbi:MAG: sensor histidine kinase [Granulosicoccus sp.]
MSNSALSTALFMDSFIAPLIQEMGNEGQISDENEQQLSNLIDDTPLGEQVLSFKIWGKDGLVVHSSNKDLIGQRFPISNTLKGAWEGKIQAEFDELDDAEDSSERSLNIPLLEIYSPIRNQFGGIIAVSEFYSNAEQLELDLFNSTRQTWVLFGIAGLSMFAALSGIALRGSRTIGSQQATLTRRVSELTNLRKRLETASRRNTEFNESYLRRIGSDLHDGPAQLLALALLKLDALENESLTSLDRVEMSTSIKEPLVDALADIRNLSRGLVLPGLEDLSLPEIMIKAVNSHQRRTGVLVNVDNRIHIREVRVPESIKICVYRFIQEALNNAYHHANVQEAFLKATIDGAVVSIDVWDKGAGFNVDNDQHRGGLGIPGLRERIESIGGSFDVESALHLGTRLSASFNIDHRQ